MIELPTSEDACLLYISGAEERGIGRLCMTARMSDEEPGLLPRLGTPFHTIYLRFKQQCRTRSRGLVPSCQVGLSEVQFLEAQTDLRSLVSREERPDKDTSDSGRIVILYSADEQLRP